MSGRLARGIGANLYGQVVTIAIQIVSIPLLIHAWGTARFGMWVVLSALPMALSFADGGLVLASGNAMALAAARGDDRAASQLFGQAVRVVGLVALAVMAVVGVAVSLVPNGLWPGSLVLRPQDTRFVVLALAAVVLLGLISSLIAAAFRAAGRYPSGILANDSIRLLESAAVLGVAQAGGDLGTAAAAWLIARVLGVGVSASLLVRVAPWVTMRNPPDQAPGLRPLLSPALAALAIPAAFAVSLQGSTVALGAIVPPGGVALFVATRTLTRAMIQASGLVNHALMPEMAVAAGRADHGAMAALSRLSTRAALILLLPAWAILLFCGPTIIETWTGHALHADPLLVAVMATAALVHGLWLSSANLLLAINRQADYAWMFLGCAIVSVATVPALAGQWGVLGAALATLGGEAAMALWFANRRRSVAPVGLTLEGAGR